MDNELRIYFDKSDPANPGWAWATFQESGPIDDAGAVRALAATMKGCAAADADWTALLDMARDLAGERTEVTCLKCRRAAQGGGAK